jgi:DNA-binding transcriptional regulator YhcF (GntR family)
VAETDGTHTRWDDVDDLLDSESVIPAHVQVAYLMRGAIIARQLPVGTPVPSEKAIATRWGLSHGTVHQAYDLLVRIGVVGKKRGVGYYVNLSPCVKQVTAGTGSRVTARPPTPLDRKYIEGPLFGAPLIIVEQPGEPPAYYDAMSTVVSFT